VVNATPRLLYPCERSRTHCVGGWAGLRTSLDGCGKSHSPQGFDPRTVQARANDKLLILFIYLFILCFSTLTQTPALVTPGPCAERFLIHTSIYIHRPYHFRTQICHWNFSLTTSFRPHYGTGVDSASNRNECQGNCLVVKAAGA